MREAKNIYTMGSYSNLQLIGKGFIGNLFVCTPQRELILFCRGDQFAAKAAGHELKALMRFYGLVDGLHVPLMCLVDYRGFRLVAISILPIHKGTLVYGSDDCGATIWKCNKKFSELMSVAGNKLNLKKHVAGHDGTARKRKIYGPGGMSQLNQALNKNSHAHPILTSQTSRVTWVMTASAIWSTWRECFRLLPRRGPMKMARVL